MVMNPMVPDGTSTIRKKSPTQEIPLFKATKWLKTLRLNIISSSGLWTNKRDPQGFNYSSLEPTMPSIIGPFKLEALAFRNTSGGGLKSFYNCQGFFGSVVFSKDLPHKFSKRWKSSHPNYFKPRFRVS